MYYEAIIIAGICISVRRPYLDHSGNVVEAYTKYYIRHNISECAVIVHSTLVCRFALILWAPEFHISRKCKCKNPPEPAD